MEALPEQGSLLSSILQTDPRTTRPPELPPIEHETLPLPRIWQGTSFDSDWERQARAVSSTAQQPTGSRLRNTPVLPATSGPHDIFVSSTSELDLVWDNLNLPHTAFFPPRENPYRWGTAEYPSVIHWDEPVRITTRSPTPPEQTRESTPEFPPRVTPDRLAIPRRRREPPRSVVEVAEELNQFDRDRRQAEH